jgi:mono/diheme cytochrome c family protein
MSVKFFWLGSVFAAVALATDPAQLARGEKEEAQNCVACHSLRIVHVQRLSKAVWNRELDKMASWGTKIEDRESLVEYLVANFGDHQPPAPPVLTRDAVSSSPDSASRQLR